MEVIDFFDFLKTKNQKQFKDMVDLVIEENGEALKELSK